MAILPWPAQVFIDVLTGQFEVTAAIMSGQMLTDDFTAMMGFKRAFKFEKAAYQEFCACREAPAVAPAADGPAAGAGGATEGHCDAPAADGDSTGAPGDAAATAAPSDAPPVTAGEVAPAEPAQRTISEAQHAQLEGLADDPELQFATSFLFVAFEQSSMEIRLLCHLSDGDKARDMTICVTPDGVQFLVGASDVEPTCTVSCTREVLMQIIRGELDATNAIVGGLVAVDDIAQIMCFKMAFKLERAVFDAYLASRPT